MISTAPTSSNNDVASEKVRNFVLSFLLGVADPDLGEMRSVIIVGVGVVESTL